MIRIAFSVVCPYSPTTMTSYDIIIVGGGIMGAATAYNLINQDPKLKVVMIEKDHSYQYSSTAISDGNSRVQFNLPENIKISLYALEALKTFEEDMAIPSKPNVQLNFRQQGNMFVIDNEQSLEYAKQGLKTQRELGAEVEWLEPKDFYDHYPLVDPDVCLAATLGTKDGTMSPNDVLQGYRRKAEYLGVELLEAEVVELIQQDGQMMGVKLANGDLLHSSKVVNTTGAWMTPLAATAGIKLPIRSIKREVYSVATDATFDEVLTFVILPSGQYLHHEGGNHFVTGGASPADPETTTDFSWSQKRFEEEFWEKLIHYAPAFDRLKVLNGWGGLYAVNDFDGNALLGEWPEVKGFYLAGGFSGHGFQQGHAVGRYMADVILGTSNAPLDLSLFNAGRILENKPVFENPARII